MSKGSVPRKIFFSNHWESETSPRVFRPEKYTPGAGGKWKNLEICFNITESDYIVINDAPRDEDSAFINLVMSDAVKHPQNLLWFTREPVLCTAAQHTFLHDGSLKKILAQQNVTNVRVYHYPEDNIPLLGTWHLPDNYDFYVSQPKNNKPNKISALFSHKLSTHYVVNSSVSTPSRPALTTRDGSHFDILTEGGYALRQRILDETISSNSPGLMDLDVYGRCCTVSQYKDSVATNFKGEIPPARKFEAFRDYQYSIVVENSRVRNYFTEKLLDCFLERTVPLYWGCPNILEYFPEKSLILISEEEAQNPALLAEKIARLKEPSEEVLEAVEEARRLVLEEYNIWDLLHQIIEDKR
jgi:hypothetical protein